MHQTKQIKANPFNKLEKNPNAEFEISESYHESEMHDLNSRSPINYITKSFSNLTKNPKLEINLLSSYKKSIIKNKEIKLNQNIQTQSTKKMNENNTPKSNKNDMNNKKIRIEKGSKLFTFPLKKGLNQTNKYPEKEIIKVNIMQKQNSKKKPSKIIYNLTNSQHISTKIFQPIKELDNCLSNISKNIIIEGIISNDLIKGYNSLNSKSKATNSKSEIDKATSHNNKNPNANMKIIHKKIIEGKISDSIKDSNNIESVSECSNDKLSENLNTSENNKPKTSLKNNRIENNQNDFSNSRKSNKTQFNSPNFEKIIQLRKPVINENLQTKRSKIKLTSIQSQNSMEHDKLNLETRKMRVNNAQISSLKRGSISAFQNSIILNQMKEKIYKSIIKYFKSNLITPKNQRTIETQTNQSDTQNIKKLKFEKKEKQPSYDCKLNINRPINLKQNHNKNNLCLKSNSYANDSVKQSIKHNEPFDYFLSQNHSNFPVRIKNARVSEFGNRESANLFGNIKTLKI